MTSQAFKQALERTPFQPFQLRLPDGRTLPVSHPELAYVTPPGRTVFIFEPGTEYYRTIDLMLVSELEPLSLNGKKKRRS